MDIRKKVFTKLVMVVAALAVIIFATTMFGMEASGEDNVNKTKAAYYHEMEEVYANVLSEVMSKKGYGNAGINISSIISADGSREYTVKIHHDSFYRMDDSERADFIESISYLKFTDPEVLVTYDILL